MKKVMRILTSYVLCAAICLSVAACGGGDSLQKYLDDNKAQIEEVTSALASTGMDVVVEADGNTLVYKFTYTADIPDVDAVKEALATSMDAMSSTFEGVLTELKEEVKSAEAVKVVYLDKDGNELYAKEFK